jgi:hypothetical protein
MKTFPSSADPVKSMDISRGIFQRTKAQKRNMLRASKRSRKENQVLNPKIQG